MRLMRTLLMIGGGVAAYRLLKNRRQMGRMMAMMTTKKGFLQDAAECNLLEIRMGHLALEKSGSDEVRQYGQRLIDDHTRNQERLRELALQHGCTMPNVMTTKHLNMVEQMGRMSGEEFDRRFITAMIDDHNQDIGKFETAAATLGDENLRTFANDTLAMLREHLRLAETIAHRQRQAA